MKHILGFLVFAILGSFACAQAAVSGTVCGAIDREKIQSEDQFVLSVFKNGKFEQVEFLATSPSAQNMLAVISVHGGKVCKPKLPADAPASVCVKGDLRKKTAEKILCQETKPCQGFRCN